ncbi:AGAP009528-PA-like protein [Anopheles sinensis]|uniref:AGAP009528-PA-like protein n=1 Tax=Anopheles sinensis TaxID=74873 RepID=A0A084VLS5_ANOSI|nr:AGAP009528-PA-like protein [Anopheles sinensis]
MDNIYSEFREFPRTEIQRFNAIFKKRADRYDDGCLDLFEVTKLMEKLGNPQTHLKLKAEFTKVDSDQDGRISFGEFMKVYREVHSNSTENNVGVGDAEEEIRQQQGKRSRMKEIDQKMRKQFRQHLEMFQQRTAGAAEKRVEDFDEVDEAQQ